MHPSEKQYSVVISIEEFDYARSDGTEIWRKRSVLNVGPHQRIAISKDRTVSFYSRYFMYSYLYVYTVYIYILYIIN